MPEPTIPLTDGGLPLLQGPTPILLPAEPPEAVAARWPASVEAWARLGEAVYRQGQDVEAFAFFRTAYHRGLDNLRRNGWRGLGFVPWAHAPNRGVLRALHALSLAAAAIGEADEAARCAQFVRDCDPAAADALA